MSVLGQMPCRSGSPQAVFGGEYGVFAGCCAASAPTHNDAIPTAVAIGARCRLNTESSSTAATRPVCQRPPLFLPCALLSECPAALRCLRDRHIHTPAASRRV